MGLGAFCLVVVSFLAYHWLTEPVLTDADLTHITGTLTTARVYHGTRPYLELTVSDQPYPFRCFSELYPKSFNSKALALLRPGAPVVVGVPTAEMASPRRNWVQDQKFYRFVTLQIIEREALPLSGYNRSVESNRRIGPWFCLAMAFISVWLMREGYSRRL